MAADALLAHGSGGKARCPFAQRRRSKGKRWEGGGRGIRRRSFCSALGKWGFMPLLGHSFPGRLSLVPIISFLFCTADCLSAGLPFVSPALEVEEALRRKRRKIEIGQWWWGPVCLQLPSGASATLPLAPVRYPRRVRSRCLLLYPAAFVPFFVFASGRASVLRNATLEWMCASSSA